MDKPSTKALGAKLAGVRLEEARQLGGYLSSKGIDPPNPTEGAGDRVPVAPKPPTLHEAARR